MLILALLLVFSSVFAEDAPTENMPTEETSAPINTSDNGPYVNGAIGFGFYKSDTDLAWQAGYGYSQLLTAVNPVAPIFLGAEANFSRFTDHASSIDALAIFGLQLNKSRIYLKAGPDFVMAEKNDFSAKGGVGVSYPLFKTFRTMLEVQYTRQQHRGMTSVVSGLQYYF